jgi:hypothetical protein
MTLSFSTAQKSEWCWGIERASAQGVPSSPRGHVLDLAIPPSIDAQHIAVAGPGAAARETNGGETTGTDQCDDGS